MQLLEKLLDAEKHDSGMSLSAHDVRELIDLIAETEAELATAIANVDYLGERLAPGKRSVVRN